MLPTPPDPQPQITVTDSYSEGLYLAGLTCNMDNFLGDLGISTVRAHIGRSTGRSTPPLIGLRHHGKKLFYLINIILLWDVFYSNLGFGNLDSLRK